jgi:hypothetical protein
MEDSDTIGRFCAAFAAGDVDAVLETLSADAELQSPLIARAVFRGHRNLRVLFGTLLPVLKGLTWQYRVSDANLTVALSTARVLGVPFSDAMLIEVDADGLIRRITPHARPWLGLTALALALLPRLLRHPEVLAATLRSS